MLCQWCLVYFQHIFKEDFCFEVAPVLNPWYKHLPLLLVLLEKGYDVTGMKLCLRIIKMILMDLKVTGC